MKLFTPHYFEDNFFNINFDKLKKDGIKLIITDIDNTLVPYAVATPTQKINRLFEKLQMMGFDICFLSNNQSQRVDVFNEGLGYYSVSLSRKPLPYGYKQCMQYHNCTKEETVFIGDQLFTDILGAKLAGIKCILVKPIKTNDEEFFIRLKRSFEKFILKKITPKKLGVIGNPVSHSMSPILHGFFYRKFKINAVYKKYCPTYENLGEYISYFKENGFLGFNVTVPYKQVIIKYLDYIHPDAEKIGAVNTVKIVDGKLYGYNTDGDGFCMQIKDIKGKDVKIIGAGGSVLSVVHCLIKNGAKSVTIYNRTLEKAKVIADLYDNVCAKPLDVFSADNCQILINAVLLNVVAVKDLDGIEEGTEVFDINYNKKETEFIKMALKYNVTVKNGLMMLVNQGLLAHKIWFGKEEN